MMNLNKIFFVIVLLIYVFGTMIWTKLFAMEGFNIFDNNIYELSKTISENNLYKNIDITEKNINCFYEGNILTFSENKIFKSLKNKDKFCNNFWILNKIKPTEIILNNKSPPDKISKKEKFLDYTFIVGIILLLN